MINEDDVINYGNLPSDERLRPLVKTHLLTAQNEVKALLLQTELAGNETVRELLIVTALIFILPAAHLLYIEGFPKVSEEGVNARFLSPSEVEAALKRYEKRQSELLGRVKRKSRVRFI